MSWVIPGFASVPGRFVWDKAPCHPFLAIAGLDVKCQPTIKGFLQKHCCLLPFPVVRQEGTEMPPFVRLAWVGVTNLGTGRKRFKQPPECCTSGLAADISPACGPMACW